MTLDRRARKSERRGDEKYLRGSPIKMHYVIQQHDATGSHWDLRLQMGNKMMSWAVPKGPSLNPGDARLAVETTPHDIKYNDFEGIIDKGLYGAGRVLQWDKGTYSFIPDADEDVMASLKAGIFRFEIHGEKLCGKWALVKTGNKRWLLIKMRDAYADKKVDVIREKPKSVKSGKCIKEITKEDGFISEDKDLGWSK